MARPASSRQHSRRRDNKPQAPATSRGVHYQYGSSGSRQRAGDERAAEQQLAAAYSRLRLRDFGRNVTQTQFNRAVELAARADAGHAIEYVEGMDLRDPFTQGCLDASARGSVKAILDTMIRFDRHA